MSGCSSFVLRPALALLAAAFLVVYTSAPQSAKAQSIDPAALRDVLQQRGLGGTGSNGQGDGLDEQDDMGGLAPRSTSPAPSSYGRQTRLEVEPLSMVEEVYNRRLNGNDFIDNFQRAVSLQRTPAGLAEPLRQFGYDGFAFRGAEAPMPKAAIPDSYVLGAGDRLVIRTFGNRATRTFERVGADGNLILSDIGPIPAAGRTLEEVRDEVTASLSSMFPGTQIFVSLAEVRTISVVLAGAVEEPGVYNLTSLSSIMELLQQAGGVKKTGTLRNLRLIRGGSYQQIDLYPLLLGTGGGGLPRLRDGDTLQVPTIGRTMAITGRVVRPGIYELPPGQSVLSVEAALDMAGAPVVGAGNVLTAVAATAGGVDARRELRGAPGEQVRADEIIAVRAASGGSSQTVRLSGHVFAPQVRALDAAPTAGHLVPQGDNLRPGAYLLFTPILRTDPTTYATYYTAANLSQVISGQGNVRLQNRDEVIILSEDALRYIQSEEVQLALTDGRMPLPELTRCEAALTNLISVRASSSRLRFANAVHFGLIEDKDTGAMDRASAMMAAGPSAAGSGQPGDAMAGGRQGAWPDGQRGVAAGPRGRGQDPAFLDEADDPSACPEVFKTHPKLLPFVLEHTAVLLGEVRRPGLYPLAAETAMDAVTRYAGGLTAEADLASVEIAGGNASTNGDLSRVLYDFTGRSLASLAIGPGSVVRFNAKEATREMGFVELKGEVVRPGRYDIRRDETLSEILARAGGLTDQAYPYGAVFTRVSLREKQREGLRRMARDLEVATVANMQTNPDASKDAMAAVQALVKNLQDVQPEGRMAVQADPTVLEVHPEQDVVLQPGDTLVVPKRPIEVTISGMVLNPGSVMHRSGASAAEYISLAGGTQKFADEDRAFVVLPDGTAEPVSLGSWSGGSDRIPPGSTIVVPQDPAPFNAWRFAGNITDILSKVALSAASLAVISRD